MSTLIRNNARAILRLLFLFTLSLWIVPGTAIPADADLSIVTPSPSLLQPKQVSAQGLFSFDRGRRDDALMLSGTINYIEFQGAQLWGYGKNATVVSAEAQILPETSQTPALGLGVRDLFDTTHHFGDLGYGGRSAYLVAGLTAPNADSNSYPFRDLTVALGVGTGVINGLFSSVSADLVQHLSGTAEYDGRCMNYRVALSPGTNIVRVEYDRIHGVDFIGLRLQTPSDPGLSSLLGL